MGFSGTGDSGPPRLRFSSLREEGSALVGPAPLPAGRRRGGPGLVTGGGLVAALDPLKGLVGLWQGRDLLLAGVEPMMGPSRAHRVRGFRWRGGAWTGEYDLGGGIYVTERGILPDSTAAAVFEWTVAAPADARARVPAPPGEAPAGRVTLALVASSAGTLYEVALPIRHGASATVAVIPSGRGPEATERLLTPIRVRERQRAERSGSSTGEAFTVSRNGWPLHSVVEALQRMDDAPVAGPTSGAASEILEGFVEGAPAYLEGEGLEAFGTAALYAGRSWLAARVLHSLGAAAQTNPAEYLRFSATYAFWTADLGPIAKMTTTLSGAVDALLEPEHAGVRDSLPAVAERLAAAIEPLGDKALTDRLRSLARTPAEGGTNEPSALVGGRNRASRRGGLAGLAAVRLLRRLVERDLGLEADASYGRLRFAPRLTPSCAPLDVAGVRVGDALVRMGIAPSAAGYELRILQEGGRVPLNLVFAPLLAGPLSGPPTVLLDGSRVQPDVRTVAEGTRVQMQFPLDRPREVEILAGPS